MFNVLFLCTGNSARSIMAEALLNNLAGGSDRFAAYSAGSYPKGAVHPLALETLASNDIPTGGYRSKSWDEFSGPAAPKMDFVFTVCDQAAAEVCPVWPGQPVTAHWGIPDPAAAAGSDADRRRAFRDAFLTLKRRIELFASLPLESLHGVRLQEEIKRIGES
jgi:arsenate reductase